MTIDERKELRLKILQELYDYYFSNNGSGKTFDRNSLKGEDFLAYKYLLDKNLIKDVKLGGNDPVYQITPYGIDLIESLSKKSDIFW